MSGQPWYKRYPKDFIDGTSFLTLEEKGAYSVCLDLMYARGGPIPDDPKSISSACGCSMQLWKKLRGKLIAAGKLNLTDDGRLANGRATYEMHLSRASSATQSRKGKLGGRPVGRPPKAPEAPPAVHAEPEVAKKLEKSSNKLPTKLLLFEQEANDINGMNFTEQKPIRDSEIQKESKSLPPQGRSPYPREAEAEVLEAWKKTGLPQPRAVTKHRQQQLAARLREHGLSVVLEAIEAIGRSEFCHGANDRGWRADFDFLVNPDKFTKVIEGKYEDRTPPSRQAPQPMGIF